MRYPFLAVVGLAVAVPSAALAAETPVVNELGLGAIQSALKEDPNDATTMARLAQMLRDMGQSAEADAIMDQLAANGIEIDVMHDYAAGATSGACADCPRGGIGPDVIVGDLNGMGLYGTVSGITAYAIGTTSCNIGDAQLLWISSNNQHPVIGQNLYRLKDGRFMMIGMSHLKHGFTALQQNLCATAQNPCQSSGTGSRLGIFCSDPYSTSLNASQSNLGPRWQVNAATGFFNYPFFNASYPGTIGRRLQVLTTDVTPAQNTGAIYFAEGHYVTPDDAAAGNGWNNASYRRVAFNTSLQPSFQSATQRTKPAIVGWQDVDPNVQLDYIDVPGDGRVIVASRAYDNGDGTWRYEYAVHNLDSHLSGRGFSVPVGNSTLTNVGFHSPFYHSNDGHNGAAPFSNTPWASSNSGGVQSWMTDSFAQNPNANALRWGTTYSFWFTSSSAPEQSEATITMYRSGGPATIAAAIVGPASCTLTADTNGDNVVNFSDLNVVLSAFGQTGPGNPADVNNDGVVNFSDLNGVLSEFGTDCN